MLTNRTKVQEREPTAEVEIKHTQLVEVKVPITKARITRLSFSPALDNMLGKYRDYMNPTNFQGEQTVDISGGLNALYIYCDTVEPRIVTVS